MLKASAAFAAAASMWLIALATRAQASEETPAPAAEQAPAPSSAAPLAADSSTPLEPATGTRPRRIRVLIAGDPEQREALARVLRELMARLSVELELEAIERVELAAVVAELPADARYLARCHLDLRSHERAVLYVRDPARDRILERRIERAPGDDELAREQLGHMLLAAIEGLLSGVTLGAPRSEVAAALPPPAPPTDPDPVPDPVPDSDPDAEPGLARWSLRGALLYELVALGHGPGLAHGPALALAIRSPLSSQLGMLLSAQYRLPFDVDGGGEPVAMRVHHTVALRALATLEAPLAARVVLRGGLGGGADVARVAPETGAATRIRASAARTLTLGVARALLGVDYRVSPWLSLSAALSADVDLDRAEYVLVRSDGSEAELTAPWRIRPALSFGVVLP